MRKMLGLLLVLALLLGVCCAEEFDMHIVIAVWDLEATVEDGKVVPVDGTHTVEIYRYLDDTGTIIENGQVYEGTYSPCYDHDGSILTVNGKELEFTYDVESQYLYLNGEQGDVIAVFAPRFEPRPIPANSLDEFQGEWHIWGVVKEGEWIDLNMGGEDVLALFGTDEPTVVIEGDQVTVLNALTGTATFDNGELLVETANGVFTICLAEYDNIGCFAPDQDVVIPRFYAVKW